MGKQEVPIEAAALPAPAPLPVEAPAPRAVRPMPKAPPPEAPAAQPQPRRERNGPNDRIRTCLNEIAKLQTGLVAADQRWALAGWVMNNAPPSVVAEIRRSSFDGVVRVCSEAVLGAPRLLNWISQASNQEFLREFLDDARKYEGGSVTEEYAAEQIIKTRNQQPQRKPAPDPAVPAAPAAAAPAAAAPAAAAPATPAPQPPAQPAPE